MAEEHQDVRLSIPGALHPRYGTITSAILIATGFLSLGLGRADRILMFESKSEREGGGALDKVI